MPTSVPLTTKNPGDVLTSSLWNAQLKANLDKLLNTGHRSLTVAQFAALTGMEGTAGTVAGDEVYLIVDATNGVLWHLVYESGEPSFRWRFLGGPPLCSEVAAGEGSTNTAYAALTTAGPLIALPRAGDYDVAIGCNITCGATAANYGLMSYDIGATGAVDADGVTKQQGAADTAENANVYRQHRKASLTAVTLTAKYKSFLAATAVTYGARFMAVRPVRIT